MATGFSISLEPPENGSHVVRLAGEVDVVATSEVTRFLMHLRGRVRLDCSGLTFLDAAGLRCLLGAAARLDSLHLVNVAPSVRRVLELADSTSLPEPANPPDAHRRKGATDPESIRSIP